MPVELCLISRSQDSYHSPDWISPWTRTWSRNSLNIMFCSPTKRRLLVGADVKWWELVIHRRVPHRRQGWDGERAQWPHVTGLGLEMHDYSWATESSSKSPGSS
ncbi:hypothetical protein MPTK1_1g19990 [Marchantia polymorpha subsp. ruderalis]|uniref:Uncharacterized protein n=2 Tax=Marchantia polymorpha TaxID=3197 RepID=A0AAF6AS40_MARPO|nr:hypothetical protein MARPO_0001s0336 [Marchantia polymorpha]BBM99260.1 hypothetical protein Mp_1g19990 [Marchantia polymorpha subsp. ruderalis]|eukprot:PTQ50342.1 hypothetical protein MARPO_0001s0336 [Marchantia polymorpha]